MRRLANGLLAVSLALWVLARSSHAQAQQKQSLLDASYAWEARGRALFASFSYRHLIDAQIRRKLRRGLPTKILFTALVRNGSSNAAVSSTYQSCTITWHVWEEMYRVKINRPNRAKPSSHWTPTLNGVLRRCAEARALLIADSQQVSPGLPVYLDATVRINPISDQLLSKLKRWVSRPSRTTTVTPGSALFSTFTGLFMQRIGDAERTLNFKTKARIPQ